VQLPFFIRSPSGIEENEIKIISILPIIYQFQPFNASVSTFFKFYEIAEIHPNSTQLAKKFANSPKNALPL
jgi:hypothetical protein